MYISFAFKYLIFVVALTGADISILSGIQAGGITRDEAISAFLSGQQVMKESMRFLSGQGLIDQDIEDIIQDATIAFDRNIRNNSFRQESSLKTYFHSIVQFQLKNFLRKKNRTRTEPIEGLNHTILTSNENADFNEKKLILEDLLAGLGPRCKELLTLFQFNFSMKEIAEKMSFSSDQVASNEVGKCKMKLKDIILSNKELIDLFKVRE